MEIAADEAVQTAISQIAESQNLAQRQAAFERIAAVNQATSERLVQQLVYFAARARDTKQAMAVGAIVRRLEISEETMARALAPCLESRDLEIAKSARGILCGLEKRSPDRRPDFSLYRGLLEERVRNRRELPMPLVRYMYEADPGMALLTLMRALQVREPEQIKRILWAEHMVSDVLWKQKFGFLKPNEVEAAAIEQLKSLSTHESWWVRLYVAEIMLQQPAFRRAELLTVLAGDSNQAVREAAVKAQPERTEPAKLP